MATAARAPMVVILDDEEDVESAIRSRLPSEIRARAFTVKPSDIRGLVAKLGRRITAARKPLSAKKAEETVLDKADIFIVDYDLIQAKGDDYLTGESIAYLARCYSNCGVIIALNQFHRRPTFDLTLRPQLDSFADINLSTEDLKNPGLWTEGPWNGYRPWSWPIIPKLVGLMRRRIRDLEKVDLQTTVLDFLGFPASAIERLPTSSLEILGSSKSRPEKATLRDVVRAPLIGLRGKEALHRKASHPQDGHILAARLATWLNMVLAPQDVLVDGPHLAARCPSVLGTKTTAKTLATTVRLRPDVDLFKTKALKPARFAKDFWYDRPVWFWTEIERNRLLPEVRDPWRSIKSDYVFCEDTSSFARLSTSKSFQSDLLSPYRTRYVKEVTNIDYQPVHRLALV